MFTSISHLDNTHHRGHNSTRSSTCATCNRTLLVHILSCFRYGVITPQLRTNINWKGTSFLAQQRILIMTNISLHQS